MTLSQEKLRALRAQGHHLKPIVTVGNAGLTSGVVRELDFSLEHHELVKVKLPAGEKSMRENIIHEICKHLGSEMIQHIGRIATLYRAQSDPKVSKETSA